MGDSTDLDNEARLADAGAILLAAHQRLQAKKRRQQPPLRLVKCTPPVPRPRRPSVQQAEHQEAKP